MEYKITPGKWVYEPVTYRQRYWHTRSDGFRQRYWKTVTKPGKRFEPVELWRFTAGINDAVCKGEYLSVTYQEWHLDPLSGWEGFKVRAREHINEELESAWGNCYHDRWEDWNGPPYFSRQLLPRPDDLDWRGDLMGYFTSRGEPGFWVPTGGARFGEARKRRMARKMIKGGKWFKPETLLKWMKKGVKID